MVFERLADESRLQPKQGGAQGLAGPGRGAHIAVVAGVPAAKGQIARANSITATQRDAPVERGAADPR